MAKRFRSAQVSAVPAALTPTRAKMVPTDCVAGQDPADLRVVLGPTDRTGGTPVGAAR